MVDLNTELRGPVDLSVDTIVNAVFEGSTPKYDRDRVQRIATAYVHRTGEWGFLTSLVIGQVFKETGRFRYGNQVKPEQNNYAGLGATNDGASGGGFPTEDDGVLAHMAHMALYVYGEPSAWPIHLQQYAKLAYRLEAVRENSYLGVVKVLGDFTNGRWAWSPQYPKGTLLNGYASGIAELANGLLEREALANVVTQLTSVRDIPFRVAIIPKGNRNRPALPMVPKFVTVHTTANYNRGANAEMHRRFTHNGGGSEEVSFHFVVDDTEIIQLLPLNENGWHAGDKYDGPGNRTSIAIEICENADGDFGKATYHCALLIAELQRVFHFGVEQIVQHNRWSGKDCPRPIRRSGWEAFLRMIPEPGQPLPTVPDGDDTHRLWFGETQHYVRWGFRGYWQTHGGLQEFGLPLTREFKALDDGLTLQVFERYLLEYDGTATPEWQVRGRHIVKLIDGRPTIVDLPSIVPAEAWLPEKGP